MRKRLHGGFGVLFIVAGSGSRSHASPPGSAAAADPSSLPSIVVTADESTVQRSIDRKIYKVSADLRSTTGTAADILNSIPSVEVDVDGNVSLRGDSKVTILIDGKSAAQLTGGVAGDGLLQLPAADIDRIEVMTNPPAQYKADGVGGVINIITKRTRKRGVSGSGQASVGNKHRFIVGTEGSYNTGGIQFSGAVGLRQDDKQRIISSDRAVTDPVTTGLTLSREGIDEHVRRLGPSIRAGVDCRLDDHQTVGLTVSIRERTGDRSFNQHNESLLAAGPVVNVADRRSDGHEWRLDDSFNLHFLREMKTVGEALEVSLQRSVTLEREHYAYQNFHTIPVQSVSDDNLNLGLKLETTEFNADYTLPFSNGHRLKVGYDFQLDENGYDNSGGTIDSVTGQTLINPSITNQFRYSQRIHAGYASFQTKWSEWDVQAGVRGERTEIRIHQITGDLVGRTGYSRIYPSLHLSRALSDTSTVNLALSRRVSRPDPEALNPFSDHQDTHNLRAGNPNLRPQDTLSLEVGYGLEFNDRGYGVTGYFRRNRDSVTDVTKVVSSDVVEITKANLAQSDSGGVEFTANGRIGTRLAYSLSGNLFYNEIDTTALSGIGRRSTTGLNAKASLDFRPNSASTAQISWTRSDKRLTPQGYLNALNQVNVGYKRRLRDNWSAVLTVSDVFNGQKFHRFVNTPTFTDSYERQQVGRVAYIGLVYVLNASTKSKPSAFEYDQ